MGKLVAFELKNTGGGLINARTVSHIRFLLPFSREIYESMRADFAIPDCEPSRPVGSGTERDVAARQSQFGS